MGQPNELNIVPLSEECKLNSGQLKWSQSTTRNDYKLETALVIWVFEG